MDLLKMVEEFKELNEKARKAERELIDVLRGNFVDLPSEMQQVEIQENSIWNSREKKIRKVYYPILSVPEGYKKEQEECIKKYANALDHNYVLKDDNDTEIKISEHAVFGNDLEDNSRGRITFHFNIIKGSISYHIQIEDIEYIFYREFSIEDTLERISKKKLGKAKHSSITDASYHMANAEYEVYLAALGIEKMTTSLSQIVNSSKKEIMLNEQLKAKIAIVESIKYKSKWFENEYWSTYISQVPCNEITVSLELYSIGGIKISKKEFRWEELIKEKNLPNYKKGITLQEAIELIKE